MVVMGAVATTYDRPAGPAAAGATITPPPQPHHVLQVTAPTRGAQTGLHGMWGGGGGGGDGDGGDGRRGRRRRRRAAAVAAAAAVVTLRGVEVRAGGPHQACVGVGPGAACVLRGCELGVVLVERGARCTLHRCTVRDSPTGGVLVDGGEASLLGSTVERCVEHGVLAVGGAQVTMGEGCVVRHCGSGVAAFGHGGHPGLEGAQPTGAATPPGPQTRVVLREVSVAHSRTFGLGATDGGAVRLTQHTMVSGSGEADYKVQNHGTIRLRRSATLEG
jgi:hypothetical protein